MLTKPQLASLPPIVQKRLKVQMAAPLLNANLNERYSHRFDAKARVIFRMLDGKPGLMHWFDMVDLGVSVEEHYVHDFLYTWQRQDGDVHVESIPLVEVPTKHGINEIIRLQHTEAGYVGTRYVKNGFDMKFEAGHIDFYHPAMELLRQGKVLQGPRGNGTRAYPLLYKA